MSSNASPYSHRPGGGLKFKGGGSADEKKKKKKKSSTSSALHDKTVLEGSGHGEDRDKGEGGSKSADPSRGQSPAGVDTRTEAQKKFEEVQRKRMAERVKKAAAKTHKDRVQEFNNYLEKLSEHYDIPKVGPG